MLKQKKIYNTRRKNVYKYKYIVADFCFSLVPPTDLLDCVLLPTSALDELDRHPRR